jgi:hypothetical protein
MVRPNSIRPTSAVPPSAGCGPSAYHKRQRATPNATAKLDLRTRDAAILRNTIADLTAHVGNPSQAQLRLIERAAWLTLWCARFDDKVANGAELSESEHKRYLGFNNALTRTIKLIGLKGAAQKPTSLADILARPAARESAA